MAKKKHTHRDSTTWQPRFGMRGILLLMLVVSVMATGGYYLVQSLRGERSAQLTFIIFTIAAPMIVVVVVSVMKLLLERNNRRR
jgi:hypothetical protein